MLHPWLLGLVLALTPAAGPPPAAAQVPGAPARQAEPKKDEKKPPTLWEEIKLFGYLENSYTFNFTGSGISAVNELRYYDFDEGYTFNMAELSIKKDPSEQYPFGFGLVVTAGLDAQKNHSLGIFRDEDDAFAFRNTAPFDLQEAYVMGRIPVGNGIILKGGKFVTLLGYEVIESPSNLNFSRGYLFVFGTPFTHTGGLVSYQFTDWFTLTAGVVLGWDNSRDNNGRPSYTGQFAFTPLKDLTANLNWIAGPEQNDSDVNKRFLVDVVLVYTGMKNVTLATEVLYGHEDQETFIASLGTRRHTDAASWGRAVWAAYDWTDKLRTSVRQEYFKDADGARTGFGSKLSLWSTTATIQYKIWKGLVGRLEYRHDEADERVFRVRYSRPDITSQGIRPRSKTLDTLSLSLYYSFF